MTQILEKVKTGVETVKEKLSFKELVEIWKGSQDSEKRALVVLDPKIPQTSTNLNANQVDYVQICKDASFYFPELEPLEKTCNQFLLTSLSKDGFGVSSMIQHEQAINEKRMIQLGLRPQDQGKENVKAK